MTYTLILLNVFIHVLQYIYPITYYYSMIPIQILIGQNLYTLVTSIFLHADPVHLLMNMYFLFIFGVVVEREVHPITYLLLFLISGIIGNLGHILITITLENLFFPGAALIRTLGASGAIFGIMAAYAYLMPRRPVSPYGYGDTSRQFGAWNFIIMYFVLEVVMMFTSLGSGIAHGAHVFGFLGGYLIAFVFNHIRLSLAKRKAETEYDSYDYYG